MVGQAGGHDTSLCDAGRSSDAGTRCRGLLRMLRFAAVLVWLLVAEAAGAQSELIVARPGETLPSFEVASIREDTSGNGSMSINSGNDADRAENDTLKNLIMNAWDIRSDAQIRGGPEDLLNKHFDVNARISQDDVTRMAKLSHAERRRYQMLMLQSMLVDRFGLVTHIETQEKPVFALIVAKGGPKLHAAAAEPAGDGAKPQGKDGAGHHQQGMWTTFNQKRAELTAYGSTLDGLAATIAFQPEADGRVVIDKTGLTGKYDYSLQWAPEWMLARPASGDPASGDSEPAGPSLLTALQDQLGLKLVPEKAPVQVLVIDHVDPPSAN